MPIKTIEVSNFKSFDEFKIDLKDFNVIIGANASGKSNLIQFFRFVRDIMDEGLENAISLQGGIEYLRNINLGSSKNFSMKIHCETSYEYGAISKINKKKLVVEITELIYELVIAFHKTKFDYRIEKDMLKRKFKLFLRGEKEDKEKEYLESGEIIISRIGKRLNIKHTLAKEFMKKYNLDLRGIFYFAIFSGLPIQAKTPIIESPTCCVYPEVSPIGEISIYDFDPKLSKRATPITGRAELEEDGRNLAVIINNILRNKKLERQFNNLIKDFLPFVEGANIEKTADISMLLMLKEKYHKRIYLPASFISDGTIHIVALILALYFEEKANGEIEMLKIIEEPERNIHPYLIIKVIDMMKNASDKNQIIATTHNPEIVKYVDIENLLLVQRDINGFSKISRPIEKKEIKTFLKNEIGIDELYIQNLLEI